jgi:hypothetical protein
LGTGSFVTACRFGDVIVKRQRAVVCLVVEAGRVGSSHVLIVSEGVKFGVYHCEMMEGVSGLEFSWL